MAEGSEQARRAAEAAERMAAEAAESAAPDPAIPPKPPPAAGPPTSADEAAHAGQAPPPHSNGARSSASSLPYSDPLAWVTGDGLSETQTLVSGLVLAGVCLGLTVLAVRQGKRAFPGEPLAVYLTVGLTGFAGVRVGLKRARLS